MDDVKRERNIELIDKAINYLIDFKENEIAQEDLDIQVNVSERTAQLDVEIKATLDLGKYIG